MAGPGVKRGAGDRPRVVIVGGGFGGLHAARALARADADVTLVDRTNHHLFQPLLYQVATAALNPGDIAEPIRGVLSRQRNLAVRLGEVAGIAPAERAVLLEDGARLPYDALVVAAGATHSYFGRDEWAPFAPGLKTLEDATELRRRILTAFERAEHEPDPARRRALLTFVVVGGGPTGVELAGALAELSRLTLARDFRHIRTEAARVILVEGTDRVLPTFHPALSDAALADLERLGVTVWTGKLVTGLDPAGVTLGEERLAARTVLWAAGVQGSPLARTLGAPLDRAGRVLVAPDLSVPGRPEIFVVGDLAAVKQADGSPVPGVAPAAIQEGRHAGRNVLRRLRGEPTRPFAYFDKGSMATIGRGRAVAAVKRLRLTGFVAWLAWLLIHIWFLVGFRNRVAVISQWAWHYLTARRGTRLVTGTAPQAALVARYGAAPPDLATGKPAEAGAGAADGSAAAIRARTASRSFVASSGE